jgi:hypothetical protein
MAETSRIATSPRWGVLSGPHSMIYALVDGSPRINELHVEAAIAVWDYWSESARLIFGNRTGHADVDKLIDAIEAVGRKGRIAPSRRGCSRTRSGRQDRPGSWSELVSCDEFCGERPGCGLVWVRITTGCVPMGAQGRLGSLERR